MTTTNVFHAWTTPWHLTTNRTCVIVHCEGLLVGKIPCLRSLSAAAALLYLAQRLRTSTSSVGGNPLAGSTHEHGLDTGDSFSLLCLVLLIWETYSFLTTCNIISTSAEHLWRDILKGC